MWKARLGVFQISYVCCRTLLHPGTPMIRAACERIGERRQKGLRVTEDVRKRKRLADR
jgi:hypothetical protein